MIIRPYNHHSPLQAIAIYLFTIRVHPCNSRSKSLCEKSFGGQINRVRLSVSANWLTPSRMRCTVLGDGITNYGHVSFYQ